MIDSGNINCSFTFQNIEFDHYDSIYFISNPFLYFAAFEVLCINIYKKWRKSTLIKFLIKK